MYRTKLRRGRACSQLQILMQRAYVEKRFEWKWNCRGLQQDEAGPLKRDLHDTQGLLKACRSALLAVETRTVSTESDASLVNKP